MVKPDMDDPRWKRMAGNRCFCSGCGEYFTSVSGFDKHQKVNGPCYRPEERGLILNDIGYYQYPGSETRLFTDG